MPSFGQKQCSAGPGLLVAQRQYYSSGGTGCGRSDFGSRGAVLSDGDGCGCCCPTLMVTGQDWVGRASVKEESTALGMMYTFQLGLSTQKDIDESGDHDSGVARSGVARFGGFGKGGVFLVPGGREVRVPQRRY